MFAGIDVFELEESLDEGISIMWREVPVSVTQLDNGAFQLQGCQTLELMFLIERHMCAYSTMSVLKFKRP